MPVRCDVASPQSVRDAFAAIAERHGLTVVEDACEALGAEYRGRPVGSSGRPAVFAFYPNKQMTTGEGGAVAVATEEEWALMQRHADEGARIIDRLGFLGSIRSFGLLQELLDLGSKPGVVFHQSVVAHRLVLARVGLDLGAIQRNGPKLHQSQLSCQPRYLNKQLCKLGQMPKPKIADRSVRGEIARSKHPKRDILVKLSCYLARREHSRGIPVHQNLYQHCRIKRLVTPPIAVITGIKFLQVQPIDDFAHKIPQVILRQPFPKRRWQQKILIRLVGKKRSRHRLYLSHQTSLGYTRFGLVCKKIFCRADS